MQDTSCLLPLASCLSHASCHPERSEGSRLGQGEVLRCAQHDRPAGSEGALAGQIVALVKPQFEAGRARLGKGGVVRDPAVHRAVLVEITDWAAGQGMGLLGLLRSPIKGPAGNVEFLAWWAPGRPERGERAALIEACLAQGAR